MEKCSHCQKGKYPLLRFEYNELLLCNTCFTRLIESRVKKNIKIFGSLEKGDILYLSGDRLSKEIAYYILSKIFDGRFISVKKTLSKPKLPDKISNSKQSNSKQQGTSKRNIICYTDSLEETAHNIIEGLFKNSAIEPIIQNQLKNLYQSKKQKNYSNFFNFFKQIYLFCDIPFEELILYQKYQRIKLNKNLVAKFSLKMNLLMKNSLMFKSLNPSKKELFGLISSFKKLNTLTDKKR